MTIYELHQQSIWPNWSRTDFYTNNHLLREKNKIRFLNAWYMYLAKVKFSFINTHMLRVHNTVTSHERHCAPNHRQFDCLSSNLFALTTMKHQYLHQCPFFDGSLRCIPVTNDCSYRERLIATMYLYMSQMGNRYNFTNTLWSNDAIWRHKSGKYWLM